MVNHPPLVYVYTGNPLPAYARWSLKLAVRNYPGVIIVIVDQPVAFQVPGVSFVSTESWYDQADFEAFAHSSPLDPLFRGGFWLRAAERFFVLEQFMRKCGHPSLFHAELDVLVLDLEGLSDALDAYAQAVFAPVEGPSRALASLMYVNDVTAMSKLVDFCRTHTSLGNEMVLLGTFLRENPKFGKALASDRFFDPGWPYLPSTVSEKNGLVDTSGFGPWLLGEDPKNVQYSSWNHYRQPKLFPIEELTFRGSISGKSLRVSTDKRTWRTVRAIHVHAKTFRRLSVPGILALYATIANLPIRIPITLKAAGVINPLQKALLSRRMEQLFSRFTPLLRGALGRVLVSWVSRSPVPTSNRERAFINNLLPSNPLGQEEDTELPTMSVSLEELSYSVQWNQLVQGLDGDIARRYLAEAAVFFTALSLSQPTLFHYGQNPPRLRFQLIGKKGQVLFPSGDKSHPDAQHARAFWDKMTLETRWSFTASAQLINPDWVKEMFPGGVDDVTQWFSSGIKRPHPSLSAFQSYGMWAMSAKRKKVKLANPAELSNQRLPSANPLPRTSMVK